MKTASAKVGGGAREAREAVGDVGRWEITCVSALDDALRDVGRTRIHIWPNTGFAQS